MAIRIDPEYNSRFRNDLKHIQKNPLYKTIYDAVLVPFLEMVEKCQCNLVCISKILQHKDIKKYIGSNVVITKDAEWCIFKCRVTSGAKGKSSSLRFWYLSFTNRIETIPITVYLHGDTQRDLKTSEILEIAKNVLKKFISAD